MSTEITRRNGAELAEYVDQVITAWLDSRSAGTKRGYLSDLADFTEWLGAKSMSAAVNTLLRAGPGRANEIVMRYQTALKDRDAKTRYNKRFPPPPLSASTINRKIAALRSMTRIARRIGAITWKIECEGLRQTNLGKMAGPKLADLQLLNRAAERLGNGKMARRDRAILACLVDLALRRSELTGLDFTDVICDQNGRPITVMIRSKGQRDKEGFPVPSITAKALSEWIAVRGEDGGPLFYRLNRPSDTEPVRLSGEAIRVLVKKLSKLADLRIKVRPHGLRHSAITIALDAGAAVRDVQKYSRHASIDMVLRYDDNRRDVAGRIAGIVASKRTEE